MLRKRAYTTVLWENDTYKGLVMEVIIVGIKVDSAWYSGLNTNNLKHPWVSLINIILLTLQGWRGLFFYLNVLIWRFNGLSKKSFGLESLLLTEVLPLYNISTLSFLSMVVC